MKFPISLCVILLLLNYDKGINGQTSVLHLNQTSNTTTEAILLTSTAHPCSKLNCTEDERCEKKDGVYGCSCKQKLHSDLFDFNQTCESSSGFVSLSRCQLFEAGFPSDILHLNDPNCRGTVQNGKVEFYFDNNDHICGTSLMANGTHIFYENFILGESNKTEDLISRKKNLKIRFRCVYSQRQNLSLDINPLESTVYGTPPAGQGSYEVRMVLYQDSAFSQPFADNMRAEMNETIFVEVRVDGVDSRQFASVIDSCWATPVSDPLDPLQWDLITNMCPSPNDQVQLLQNGVSISSRFSFSMFVLTTNSTQIFLHCAVHLCLLTGDQCSVQCDTENRGREGRSVILRDSTLISVGPMILSKGNEGLQVQVQMSTAPCLRAFLMILLSSMMSVVMI